MKLDSLRKTTNAWIASVVGAVLMTLTTGCPPASHTQSTTVAPEPARMQALNLTDVSAPQPSNDPITLSAARNEWTNFCVQVNLPAPEGYWLRLRAPRSAQQQMSLAIFSAYQVLSMPIDAGGAGYVRHTGLPAARRELPRALLPQVLDDGALNLTSLRNPLRPTDPRSRAGGPGAPPATLWFDLHVPRDASPGEYLGQIELMSSNEARPPAIVPLRLLVQDFDIPDERHLRMVGRLEWDRLEKLYPAEFETFTPNWVNRREGRYQATVRTLDHLIALAEENRANLVVPGLGPIVKWPAGEGPKIDWADFDSMVRPWFTGEAFSTKVGLGFWPLPPAEMLDRYDPTSRLQYWAAAAEHFQNNGWLDLTAVSLAARSGERPTTGQSASLCAEAGAILECNPRLRVLLPLDDSQVQLADPKTGIDGIEPASIDRVLSAGGPLVSSLPRAWGEHPPRHWLRTDLPGLVPEYGAGGDERDVRVWAWLAFLRHIDRFGAVHVFEPNFILWDSTLPREDAPMQQADPGEMVWFYPGSWFGVDLPVPTVQMKWVRRAQQDYEYLLLAQNRGEVITALQLARLIAKPVALEPNQAPDPAFALMTGATSQDAWEDARSLLTDSVLLRGAGQAVDPNRQEQLHIRALQVCAPREHPLLMARAAQWRWSPAAPDRRAAGLWVDMNLRLGIYNASETTPDQNRLRISLVPTGWEVNPGEISIPRLATYRIADATLHGRFNLDHLTAASREPMEVQFVNGFTRVVSPLKVVLPVAVSDRREGALSVDGGLDDWSTSDCIGDGPLVKMLDRVNVQRQELVHAATQSTLYSCWGRDNFYLAFALNGVAPPDNHGQNFVSYENRRAWGEDLCEILIQPIGNDNSPGPVLHLVCKPGGGVWIERKESGAAESWQPMNGSIVRYATTRPDASTWRGEIAIPWPAIVGNNDRPALMRFNFSQHRSSTGESASWAGPIDFGRDDALMGLLYLRSQDAH